MAKRALCVGTFRLLALTPSAAATAAVLTDVVQGIGTLVKCLATEATTHVPGLAAMRPGCDFLTGLRGPGDDGHISRARKWCARWTAGWNCLPPAPRW